MHANSLDGTIFNGRYLSALLDEGHEMRNIGVKYYAALRALMQASIKVVLTATPLLTSPRVNKLLSVCRTILMLAF